MNYSLLVTNGLCGYLPFYTFWRVIHFFISLKLGNWYLPYITEEILIYNTGNEALEESQGILYRDCTEDFRENMYYIKSKYPEQKEG